MRIDKEVRRMFWEAAKHYLADFSHKKSKFLKTAISTSGIDSLAITAVKRNISILLEIIVDISKT